MVQAPLFVSEFIVPKFKKIESREVFFLLFYGVFMRIYKLRNH